MATIRVNRNANFVHFGRRACLLLTIFLSSIVSGQLSKSETRELKKIGNITVSISKVILAADTVYLASLSQMKTVMMTPTYSGGVSISQMEIPLICSILDSFSIEIKKGKPKNDISQSFRGVLTMVICSYTKDLGWEIYISDLNKDIKESYDKASQNTGVMMAPMVIVKPKQLKDLIAELRKIEQMKF